ncbi:MAG: dTMP kinase [Rhizomicrobium sp.]
MSPKRSSRRSRRRKWVLCDRFTDSTYAYQGAGHGLARETIRRMETLVLDDFRPDLTLILDLPVEAGLARTAGRTKEMRFEAFDLAFHNRMRQPISRSRAATPRAAW